MGDLDLNLDLPWQHLLAAFLAMEPSDSLLSLARKCGGGSITEDVQSFIWARCNNRDDSRCHVPYLKNLLKKLIREVESSGGCVLDEFYERYASYMASLKEDESEKGTSWIVKYISFIFHEAPTYSEQKQLVVPLQCSVNMLQGDTGIEAVLGVYVDPQTLITELFPPFLWTGKQVGSGVGLLGVCLQHVKASKVILTDGDASSLANLKVNLEMNKISNVDVSLDKASSYSDVVQCIHLPWECAEDTELRQISPDIILGADVIYDPSCLPHLIRVLSVLLNRRKATNHEIHNDIQNPFSLERSINQGANGNCIDSGEPGSEVATVKYLCQEMEFGPVAFIASVIRNVDTFKCFLNLSRQADLRVWDLTRIIRPPNLLPYMHSYTRSDVHLFLISHLCS